LPENDIYLIEKDMPHDTQRILWLASGLPVALIQSILPDRFAVHHGEQDLGLTDFIGRDFT